MTLSTGSRLGPYEILAPIGAGGMGEVYRARDTKLGRDVAIKVLPDAFARDAARMARFGREAKLLAALNHTNIATIHGIEDSESSQALVMELAEGPTLADRIHQGPMPVDEALQIARQIAEALEYAHEHGIIHRDLKPSNIKIAPDDTVKVLDFGLAKAMEADLSAEDIANSPTLSRMATEAGVLLGTAAYMAPEQAKAKQVDRRADIWAFGCVLYEMLTGTRAFRGDSVTDTLAAVIRGEIDWTKLPAATPVRVRVLLQRCLQKDPKQRLRDIGDARISLDEVLSGAPDAAPPVVAIAAAVPAAQWKLWLVAGVIGALVSAAGFLAFLLLRQKTPVVQAMRFEIPVPERFVLGSYALSPNGRQLAFIGTGTDGQPRVWVRSVDALDVRPLDGTEGAAGFLFWSPDSRYVAFLSQGKLKKVEAAGGPPLALCDATSMLGGAWNSDDKVIFATNAGLFEVSASGGSASPLTTDGAVLTPSFLPDGRHFIYAHWSAQGAGLGIFVGSLDTPPNSQPPKRLISDLSTVAVPPSSDPAVRYLVFVRGTNAPGATGTLMAQALDTRRLELAGEAVPIAEQVSNLSFSTSATDVLVYVKGSQSVTSAGVRGIIQGQLAWFSRDGKALGTFGDTGSYRTVALSPDGKRVAFDRADSQNSGTRNIWLYDFTRGVTTRFTFDSAWDAYPLWSPDGSRIAFGSNREGNWELYQKTSDLAGEDELLYKSGDAKVPTSWSPDGHSLLYFNPVPPGRLWFVPLGSADRKPTLLERSEFSEAVPRFSPDGRWIAYSSDESGKNQIYVRPFTPPDAQRSSAEKESPVTGKWMVSKDGGTNPIWRRDGKELFYLSAGGGTAMAVEVSTTGVFQAGVPKPLFSVPPGVLFWDVSPDGQRFLMPAPSATSSAAPPKFTVVLNWQSALKK
jgi:Tol biopolymer transport system component